MIDFQGPKLSTVEVERGIFVAASVILVAIMGMVGSMAKDMMGHAVMSACIQALYNLAVVFLFVFIATIIRLYNELIPEEKRIIYGVFVIIRLAILGFSFCLLGFTFHKFILRLSDNLGAPIKVPFPLSFGF